MIALLSQWRLALAAGGCALALSLFALWRLEAAHARDLQGQVEAAQAAQKQAQAQAAAAGDAEAVVAQGAQRDDHTLAVHQENSHDIEAASGSGQGLDPGLNAAGRRGLCAYASYADDPGCVQLRGDGPGQRPQAGGADAAADP